MDWAILLNNVNDKFDGNRSDNNKTYQLDGHIHCVTIDSILMFTMKIICNNTRTNCSVCQPIIVFH